MAPHLLSCKHSRHSMAEHCMYSKDSLVRVCGGAGSATQPILKDRGAMKLCRDSIVGPKPRVLANARKCKVLVENNLHRKWKDNGSWQEKIEIYFTNLKLTYKQRGTPALARESACLFLRIPA